MGAMAFSTLDRDGKARRNRGLSESELETALSGRKERNRNLLWLCAEIERRSDDVNDREIARRLRQFAERVDYDIPGDVCEQIRARRQFVDVSRIPEAVMPFYRHYLFMLRRERRRTNPEDALHGPELD